MFEKEENGYMKDMNDKLEKDNIVNDGINKSEKSMITKENSNSSNKLNDDKILHSTNYDSI